MLDLDIKDYLRLIGWILVFLFPIWVIYKTGGPEQEPLLDDIEYQRQQRLKKFAEERKRAAEKSTANTTATATKTSKNKKKNKKNKAAVNTAVDDQLKIDSVQNQQRSQKLTSDKNKKTDNHPNSVKYENNNKSSNVDGSQQDEYEEAKISDDMENDEPIREIDEHMDPTTHYARVLRIKPEEEEVELEPVPLEEGWSQVRSRRVNQKSNTASNNTHVDKNAAITAAVIEANERYIPGLDKKQRENMKRNAKKKAQKQAAAALQEERLRKHQKELEKIKIQDYYATGRGKNTPWGKNGQKSSSSKVPQSTAGINEYGQLIWD
ncbi:hypothetical protein BDF20DRAFT_916948 [Mycotypha africana]|uniref:uncharacterized protein n=1 Tax=Mycotypha africana TaxID=64632 RepID=UPI0023018377|nr:uncharacterized protein BDF20DRAFT_916948 [Mycotypha africana]KAI8968421.1 hypothetical protein BDF20DRAFT_916948 [Mycotypha africana]